MRRAKGLTFCEDASFVLYRTPHVPLWRDDEHQKIVPRAKAEDDALAFWSRLAPLLGSFFSKTRRFAFQLPRALFGALSEILLGSGNDGFPLVSVHCHTLPLEMRPCEWALYVAVMEVSTPGPNARSSLVLLTALEIESLQVSRPDFFGISRNSVASEAVCTPSQCFMEVYGCKEVSERAAVRPSPDLIALVQELRRIRCFDFERTVLGAHMIPTLQHLHVIILAVGLAGLAVLTRAHVYRTHRPDLLLFYENFHWVVRSYRFQRFLNLPAPVGTVLTPELDSWVQSFERTIDDSVNRCQLDGSFAFDGRMPGRSSQYSFQRLLQVMEQSSGCIGRAATVHSFMENGLVMQSEDAGVPIPFRELVSYWQKKSSTHTCQLPGCSIQVRWTLSVGEAQTERGRHFCYMLNKCGLHPFVNEDLLLRSVGFIEGFTGPYFMCRKQGTFVGHTEQGGSSAFGVLLKENSASMKWEASYFAHGKMLDDLRKFTRGLPVLSNLSNADIYPGPLLWSDDDDGTMILEGLGLIPYFGVSTLQRPGEFAMTASSRIVGDKGMFVQYHQTTTVDVPPDAAPLVLFAQNLAPVSAEWCGDVLRCITNPTLQSDVVLRCWGLGFLLYSRLNANPLNVPEVYEAARQSVLREILQPMLEQLAQIRNFEMRVVLQRRLEELFLPFDLYTGVRKSSSHEEVFHACVCEVCFDIITALLWQEGTMYMCARCAGMRSNGVMWDPASVLDLLEAAPTEPAPPAQFPLKPPDELIEIAGHEFAQGVRHIKRTEAQIKAQEILQALLPLREGVVVAGMAMETGLRLTLGPIVPLKEAEAFAEIFLGPVLPHKWFDRYVCLGRALDLTDCGEGEVANCVLRVVDSKYAELVVERPIAAGGEILVRCEGFFEKPAPPKLKQEKKK